MSNLTKTIGGDRLGAGKKMKAHLHNYERSTHDMGYIWRSTMSAGTLVPFLVEVALPGDTFDINLDCDIKTHPTIGPLFGSYKVQLDVFQAPIRLYNSLLHNNELGIGMDMKQVKLPQIDFVVPNMNPNAVTDNTYTSPSSLMSYLGFRGPGRNQTENDAHRYVNAVPLLAYYEIYKQYYSNKQEEIGAYIAQDKRSATTITSVTVTIDDGTKTQLAQAPSVSPVIVGPLKQLEFNYTGAVPDPAFLFVTVNGTRKQVVVMADDIIHQTQRMTVVLQDKYEGDTISNWSRATQGDTAPHAPVVQTFNLSQIDEMRGKLLADRSKTAPYILPFNYEPYSANYDLSMYGSAYVPGCIFGQQGLALKTYQSDLFNNWLSSDWIEGPGGISEVTSIDTSGGSFSIDTLNLAKKVYNMLNRIAISGGTYDDWLDAVYAHDRYQRAESPMYMGGLIKELVFQEVVSNTQTTDQPLGTLAGKGIMGRKHKGGNIVIKVDEPSYIMGIISLTPRCDYSQGNKWDTSLQTLDDLHKPALDEIGFQDLITEQMAWWDTEWDAANSKWVTKSAGKQPAWINYMTNVNQTRGNFAIGTDDEVGEMFMTLNRRYEGAKTPGTGITDLTTYIDPSKFNFIFADTALDAQNFWAQIAIDMTARRKMSAKVIPNL